MSLNSINSVQSLRPSNCNSANKINMKAQNPSFGNESESNDNFQKNIEHRIVIEALSGAIIGLGTSIIAKKTPWGILKEVAAFATIATVATEIQHNIAKPIYGFIQKHLNKTQEKVLDKDTSKNDVDSALKTNFDSATKSFKEMTTSK